MNMSERTGKPHGIQFVSTPMLNFSLLYEMSSKTWVFLLQTFQFMFKINTRVFLLVMAVSISNVNVHGIAEHAKHQKVFNFLLSKHRN